MSRLLPLLLTAAIGLAACGGDDKGSDTATAGASTDAARGYSGSGPVESVQEYLDAFATGDYAKACEYIAKASKDKIEEAGSCEDVLAKAGDEVKGTDASMEGAKAGPAKLSNDTSGSVHVTTKGGIEIDIPVLVEDDRWKVDRGT